MRNDWKELITSIVKLLFQIGITVGLIFFVIMLFKEVF